MILLMFRWLKRFLARLGITTAAVGLVALVAALMWLRFFGLPERFKDRLVQELEQRGLIVEVERLLLDPRGGVIARKLTVYRGQDRQQIWVQVDRARIGFAYLAWWQGQPVVESVSVANATVSLPVGPTTAIVLSRVNAEVAFRPGALDVIGVEARWQDFELAAHGRIQLNGFPPRLESTPEQIEKREQAWRKVEETVSKIHAATPIRIEAEFALPTQKPVTADVNFQVAATGARWAGAKIESLLIAGKMKEQVISLDQFRVKLARGEFSLIGECRLEEKTAELEFTSDLDFTPLAPSLDGRARDILTRLNFNQLPYLAGKGSITWKDGLAYRVQTDLDWRDFSYSNVFFKRLTLPLAFDGNRLLIPDALVQNESGELKLDFYWDKSQPIVKAKVKSTLDPTGFTGLFGDKADRFLESCHFEKNGPVLEATAGGEGMSPETIESTGKFSAEKFSYKGVVIDAMSSDFLFKDGALTLPSLKVKRKEGEVNGFVLDDFKNRRVELKNLRTNVLVAEVAPILGPKFTEYVRPYRLDSAPALVINGIVDLKAEKPKLDTNLRVEIHHPGAADYTLMKVPFRFTNATGELNIKDRRLVANIRQSDFCGGKANGEVIVQLGAPDAEYEAAFSVEGSDFQKVMDTVFHYNQASGTMKAAAKLSGRLGQMGSLKGRGELTVEDGQLMSIPVLGGLSTLLNAAIPNFGYSKAKKGHATFVISDGFVATDDLEISSSTFTVIGTGRHNFVLDDLDLDMRVNVRGVVGLLLFPVSKLFEYHGTGSMKSPQWAPKLFSESGPAKKQ